MTDTGKAPAPSSAWATRSYRATGHCRLAVDGLARGPLGDAAAAHLVLPVEQVIAVDARTRMTGAPLNLIVQGPDHLVAAAKAGAKALMESRTVSGEIRLTVRSSGAAVTSGAREAAAAAAVDAICKAEEFGLSAEVRAQLVHEAMPEALGLARGVPGIVDGDGRILHALPQHGRLLLVVVAPVKGDPQGTYGTLVAPEGDLGTPAQFAAWLRACATGADSPMLEAMTAANADAELGLGVIGGHSPAHPIAVMLPGGPGNLLVAQRLATRVRNDLQMAKLDETWRVSILQTAAHPRPTADAELGVVAGG